MKLTETLEKFKKVFAGCDKRQLKTAKKWCEMYIRKYYYYPNDHYELLLDFVDDCVKSN